MGCVLGPHRESLSRQFGDNFVILDVKIDVGIIKAFSSDFNRKYDMCWEAGRVENIVNTQVFNRCDVYRQMEFEVSWGSFP